jgi:hypothetical protein
MTSRVQLQSPQLFWLAMLALVAALTAVVWLYRPQVKPLRAPWWWMLLALRTLVLAVLAISILRPTILRLSEESERGVVAVLVDQSKSMSVVDSSRSPAELVQLAAALDALPRDVRPATIGDLRRQVEALRQMVDEIVRAHSELEYARLAGRGAEAAETRLRMARDQFAEKIKSLVSAAAADATISPLAESFTQIQRQPIETADSWSGAVVDQIGEIVERLDAMQTSADEKLYQDDPSVRAACDAVARQSRFELVRHAITGSSGLVAKLNAQHQPVRLFGFDGGVSALQMPLDDVRADGTRSDPAGALREVRQRLALQHVTAAVVFSDGREVGSDTSAGATWSEVPVIAVAAAPTSTRDLSIAGFTVPASAALGQTVNAAIDLRAAGFDGTTVRVVLDGPGQQSQSKDVIIASGGAHVEMKVTLDRPGPHELTVSVAPQAREATDQNNRATRVVKAISEKTRVALLGGVATWDYQHLRSALLRSPSIEATAQLVDASHPGPLPKKILEQDVLILSNVPAAALDARQWDAVNRLMSDQGGSVIVIASDPAIVSSYTSMPAAASLAPWGDEASAGTRVWPGEDPMFRVMPATAEIGDAFHLADDPQRSRARWNELGPFYRFLAMPIPLKPTARPLLIERESGLPILTETRLGAGRVLLLGIDDAWRLTSTRSIDTNASASERANDRFWLGLVRYAAQEPYAASDGNLALDADRLRIEPGEPLRVRARIRSLIGFENEELTEPPTLRVIRNSSGTPGAEGTIVRSDEFSPVSGSPDRFELELRDLSSGDYELRLVVGERSLSLPLRVAQSDEAEMRDVSGDEQALAQLIGPRSGAGTSAGGGGAVIGIANVQSLPQRLAMERDGEPKFSEFRLWDSPYLFLFVVGCLGVEWAVRKRVGLA